MEKLPKNFENSFSVLITNETTHIATLPTWIKRYIENPITTVKPPHYRIFDLNILMHSVFHTYHPDITEPNKVHYQSMNQTKNSADVSHIGLYRDPTINNTICHIQPSQKVVPRVFPLLHGHATLDDETTN